MTTPNVYMNGNGDDTRTLVTVFLRGGADGLTLVPPLEEDSYRRLRPTLGVKKEDAIALDDRFGLHPLMKDLKPLFDEGELAIIPAAGSEDSTRSHFEAQDLMEHAGTAAGGWLGRFLRYRDRPSDGALSAVAIGRSVPEALRGAPAATAMESLADFSLRGDSKGLSDSLRRLYAEESGELGFAARDTMNALKRIEELRADDNYKPSGGADYGDDRFSKGLFEVARLIRARVGLEAVTVDLDGWDSHFTQQAVILPRMEQLARGLAAFRKDLGREMRNVTVVVMSEFGRRVGENTALGTAHGRGGVMFAMGGGVRGGFHGEWRGLDESLLDGPGDVPVLTNYRDVLAPILAACGAGEGIARVFPDYELNPLDILEARPV